MTATNRVRTSSEKVESLDIKSGTVRFCATTKSNERALDGRKIWIDTFPVSTSPVNPRIETLMGLACEPSLSCSRIAKPTMRPASCAFLARSTRRLRRATKSCSFTCSIARHTLPELAGIVGARAHKTMLMRCASSSSSCAILSSDLRSPAEYSAFPPAFEHS